MNSLVPSFFEGSSSFLQVMNLNFGQIPSTTTEFAAIECVTKLMYNVVTLASSFLPASL